MAAVFHKLGCQFAVIAPGGFRLLWAFGTLAALPGAQDIIITSGTDSLHSGPDDPHHLGMAYDVRTHDLPDTQKDAFVRQVLTTLDDGPLVPQADGGYVTERFFGWIEDAETPNEHAHFQVRHGVTYP